MGWREIGGDAAVFAERCAPRRVSFLAPRLATIVESCAAAAESTDARDKYFLSCPRFRPQFDTDGVDHSKRRPVTWRVRGRSAMSKVGR